MFNILKLAYILNIISWLCYRFMCRSGNSVHSTQHNCLVAFSCVSYFLWNQISIHSKKVENKREILSSLLVNPWWGWSTFSWGAVNNFDVLNTGLLIPLPSVIVSLTVEGQGYVAIHFPPIFCAPNNSDLIFYSLIIILNIMLILGIPQLIVVAWILHKVCAHLLPWVIYLHIWPRVMVL